MVSRETNNKVTLLRTSTLSVQIVLIHMRKQLVRYLSPGHNHFWILDDVTIMGVVVEPRGNSFVTLVQALATLFRNHIP